MDSMKIKLFSSSAISTAVAFAITGSPAAAESLDALRSATLTCQQSSGSNAAVITISNATDDVWILESSANLSSWAEDGVLKVHNGNFRQALDEAAGPKLFYRLKYDPDRQDLLSDEANALKLPESSFNYSDPMLPRSFLVPPIVGQDNEPDTNPTTDAGATLGRALFYDKRLSANFSIACSSCHQPQHGFSDPRKFSTGFEGGTTSRNSMGLSNARWYQRGHFFWDERAATLEDQVLQPVQNPVEMGMTLDVLTNRLAGEPFYGTLFTAAFGTPEVTSERISHALAQFVRSIVSTHSKYDEGVTVRFANFTAQENLGRQIFFGRVGNATCSACHGTDNFVPGPNINNNGLENPYVDKGLGAITGRPQDEGKFKVPSLRNIALTAPYMHDGRFATLEEVVEFYNSGVVDHPNLSPPLRRPDGSPLRLNLSDTEKAALVAFLKTLTDESMTTNEMYSDPFNYGD